MMINANGKPVHDTHAVNGVLFTAEDSVKLAQIVFKRFGYDIPAATSAWRRLLQNGCTEEDFEALVYAVEVK